MPSLLCPPSSHIRCLSTPLLWSCYCLSCVEVLPQATGGFVVVSGSCGSCWRLGSARIGGPPSATWWLASAVRGSVVRGGLPRRVSAGWASAGRGVGLGVPRGVHGGRFPRRTWHVRDGVGSWRTSFCSGGRGACGGCGIHSVRGGRRARRARQTWRTLRPNAADRGRRGSPRSAVVSRAPLAPRHRAACESAAFSRSPGSVSLCSTSAGPQDGRLFMRVWCGTGPSVK